MSVWAIADDTSLDCIRSAGFKARAFVARRMRAHAFAALLLLLPAIAPNAMGGSTPCAQATWATSTPIGVYLLPVPSTYGYEIWTEENLVPGLQKVDCVASNGTHVNADRTLGVFGVPYGSQPVCIGSGPCLWI